MELTEKLYVKIAETIRDKLKLLGNHRYREVQRLICSVNENMERLQMIRQGLDKCLCKDWNATAARLTANTQRIVRDIPNAINELEQVVKNSQAKTPTTREVYEELRQVREEFGRLEYDNDEQTLSVFTEPIELEDVFLGDFEIRLLIPQLAEMRNGNFLRVIALDPHPAATNECVTHPHVSDDCLCSGDAHVPIQTALANGRICDFFMLVGSVLKTYNPSSPYVSLSEWDGICCYDCGYVVSGDNIYYCEECENSFCDECMSYCHCCDNSMCQGCQGCLNSCQVCEESCCEDCLKTCSQCDESVCESCIENSLCPSCKEEMETKDEKESTKPDESAQKSSQQVA